MKDCKVKFFQTPIAQSKQWEVFISQLNPNSFYKRIQVEVAHNMNKLDF
jgi:hypothetical protein